MNAPCEPVLVNRGRAGRPEQHLDEEARIPVDDDRRLAERRGEVALRRQNRRLRDPFHNLLWCDAVSQAAAVQRAASDIRQLAAVEFRLPPLVSNHVPELVERFHTSTSASRRAR